MFPCRNAAALHSEPLSCTIAVLLNRTQGGANSTSSLPFWICHDQFHASTGAAARKSHSIAAAMSGIGDPRAVIAEAAIGNPSRHRMHILPFAVSWK